MRCASEVEDRRCHFAPVLTYPVAGVGKNRLKLHDLSFYEHNNHINKCQRHSPIYMYTQTDFFRQKNMTYVTFIQEIDINGHDRITWHAWLQSSWHEIYIPHFRIFHLYLEHQLSLSLCNNIAESNLPSKKDQIASVKLSNCIQIDLQQRICRKNPFMYEFLGIFERNYFSKKRWFARRANCGSVLFPDLATPQSTNS